MADSLKYSNGYLLICNDALAMTCCSDDGTLFWDAIPCALESTWRTGCDEADQCMFGDRIYVDTSAYCLGNVEKICECQRLFIKNWDSIATAVVNDVVAVTFSPPGSETGNISWTDSLITVTDDLNGVSTISTTGTIQNVVDFIEALPHWTASAGVGGLDLDLPTQAIEPTGRAYAAASTYNYKSRTPSIIYSYNGTQTDIIPFSNVPATFADNIRVGFNAIASLSGLLCVSDNSHYSPGDGHRYFEVVFCSGDACGVSHPDIIPYSVRLPYSAGTYIPGTTVSGLYGRYGPYTDYLNEDSYTLAGTGISSDNYGGLCPFTKTFWDDADFGNGTATGPFPHGNAQCCPQRGATLGPQQAIFASTLGGVGRSGYRSTAYSNLEDTVVINDECYKINEFFFMVGKEGRFVKDWETHRRPYINAGCDYTKHPASGGCEDEAPTNCAVELFLPAFHKNVPWGPFGSYYPGIENDSHRAIDYPDSHIALTYSDRIGWDYRPQGNIKTVGTWQETKEINLYLTFHRPMPWYVGTASFDDLALLGRIDPTTGASFNSTFGNGTDAIGLNYNCSGKTVGDFVNAVNALRTVPATGSASGCPIFAFCLSNPNVSGIPASKIINVSAELFDLMKYFGKPVTDIDRETYGADDPTTDELKYSGSDIVVGPHKYKDLWPKYNMLGGIFQTDSSQVLTTLYVDWPGDVLDDDIRVKLPPYCRHRTKTLPEQTPTAGDFRQIPQEVISDYFGLRSPWFRSIEGNTQTVLNVSAGSGIPSYITQINVGVTGRMISISAVSGTTIVATTGINTNAGITGYISTLVARDLNNVGFHPAGGSLFWPVVATTGGQPFTVWLDDHTRWNPVTHVPVNTGSLTTYNWSYVEPIKDVNVKNVLSDGTLNIQSFIRRRCDYNGTTPLNTTDSPLSGCVPISATKLGPNSRLDCEGDKIYDVDTAYLYTFGCTSFACKTEWYIKTTRCACSQQWDCTTKSNIAHNYNHEGDSTANRIERCYSVTQPLLYICEYNIHPQCDIPMLVKVPFQIWGEKSCFPTNGDGLGFECGSSDIAIVYADGSHENSEDDYLGEVYCPELEVYNSQTNVFLSECVGWCQHLDPVTAERVQKEDIPREWPPVAYISERGYPIFCSVNPYSEPIEEICNPSTLPQYNWDSIYGVMPVVPAQYLDNEDFIPCMMVDNNYGADYLRVITRPIINPLTLAGLCNNGDLTRIDINCATKCCNCEFKCNPSDGGITNAGPYTCPCYVDIDYSYEEVVTGIPYPCNVVTQHGGECVCNFGCCDNDVGCPVWPNAYGGTYSTTTTISISFQQDNCCGCNEEALGGPSIDYTLDKSGVDCQGVVNVDPDIEYYDFCNGIPDVGNGVACGAPTANGHICEAPASVPLNCTTIQTLFAKVPPAATGYFRGISERMAPGTSCGQGRINIWCTANTDILMNHSATQTVDDCNAITANWTVDSTTIRNGVSAYDGVTLGINGGGSTTNLTTNQVSSIVGSYSVTAETCQACPMGIQTSKTLAYVTGWLNNIDYLCEYPNMLETRATGTFTVSG